MKFKYKVNGGEITRRSNLKTKRWAKKRARRSFRRLTKAAIKAHCYELAPKWGKFHGWAD